jgi:hypothetical protein
MKKQLLIIGCYLDNDIKRDILRKNLQTLANQFDILLSSHRPIDTEFQAQAKYVIYDSNNDLGNQDGYIVWYGYGNVYQQWNYEISHNPSYAVYQLIRTPLSFAKLQGYDSFIYMEGDLLVSEYDVSKLLNLKIEAVSEGKRACFFNGVSSNLWWDCQLFYSEIDFLLQNTPNLFTFSEFREYCDNIGAGGWLESFLYHTLYSPNVLQIKAMNKSVQQYMTKSQLNLSEVNVTFSDYKFQLSSDKVDGGYTQYAIYILKEQDTDRIFLTYRRITENAPVLNVYINDTVCISVRGQEEFLYTEIFPDESFTLKLVDNGKIVRESNLLREYVLNSYDFIKFT